jgi:holo-[acyl-carrier protein] synthase
MILKHGIDIIEINRVREAIDRHGQRLMARVYTSKEIQDCAGDVRSLAARFAAKEAVAKALGCGFGKIGWSEVEIRRGEDGEPKLILYGRALKVSEMIGLTIWSVSLSHTEQHAVASAVALGD